MQSTQIAAEDSFDGVVEASSDTVTDIRTMHETCWESLEKGKSPERPHAVRTSVKNCEIKRDTNVNARTSISGLAREHGMAEEVLRDLMKVDSGPQSLVKIQMPTHTTNSDEKETSKRPEIFKFSQGRKGWPRGGLH